MLSSQVHIDHSPGETASWTTNHASINLRKLKSYQAFFLITMLWYWISTAGGEKLQKNTNSWRLNNTLLNNKEVTEEIREIKRFLETNDSENTMGFSKSSSKREVDSNTVLPQEIRKASNRQPNSTS